RYIEVWEYPDGRIEIRADDRVLPYRHLNLAGTRTFESGFDTYCISTSMDIDFAAGQLVLVLVRGARCIDAFGCPRIVEADSQPCSGCVPATS
ncbi:hypothetical protein J8I87_28335, partial [Paraburkholderia sp. LEh10]|uniref:hypothetical protein n=1 Tax=Paraburkholderia sp. LEh10 TaxID=2821353 RepID=UPI001AE3CABD